MIRVSFLLLATGAAVALREASEAGEHVSTYHGTKKQKQKPTQGYGDSKAFTMLLTLQVPPDNLEAFNKMQEEAADSYEKESTGIFLFHAFTSEPDAEQGNMAVAFVFSDRTAYIAHMKTPIRAKWLTKATELGVEILKAKFVGEKEFDEEIKKNMLAGKVAEFWPDSTGFARPPHQQKSKGKVFLIECVFQAQNDNLPLIKELNAAFVAMEFRSDPTCFFARVCIDQDHASEDETVFTFLGIYLVSNSPWSRAVEFGEVKTVQSWLKTSMQYGVKLLEQNLYGENKFKEKVKKFAPEQSTFWDFAYGYDRYKTDHSEDSDSD